jgi:lantibiotic leader peptide-processing serine protease
VVVAAGGPPLGRNNLRKLLATAAAVLLGASLLTVTAASGSSRAAAKNRNVFGLTVVRFAKGTSSASMQAAVQSAGGVVTTDLSQLNALEVEPSNGDAAALVAALKRNKQVSGAYQEKVVTAGSPDTAGGAGSDGNPQLGNPGPSTLPDPWHDLSVGPFGGAVPGGKLQWDDYRMNVPGAWARTTGAGIKVAVIDSGVQGSHKDLLANYDNQDSTNEIPCNTLTTTYGPGVSSLLGDCSSEDTDGHGTWVANRIVGAANGFASNGVAPNATVAGYKALATGFGGFTSWIVKAMVDACNDGADVINMSIGGYDNPLDPTNEFAADDAQDYLLWVDAANYCNAKGTAIFAAAGNEHIQLNRVNATVGGRALSGIGQVDAGPNGIASVLPGATSLTKGAEDLRGWLETPAGVPGVIAVSATNNQIGAFDSVAVNHWPTALTGKTDQLTYYSNYGSRIDIAAPGGARKFNIPRADGGSGDYLRDGWGAFGGLDASGDLCASTGDVATFACFVYKGAGFGFLQGTSMSSPNATGVGVLTLAAHPELRHNPAGLLAKLKATARTTGVKNYMVPNDPSNTSAGWDGTPCPTGFCHLAFGARSISFSDAYGAGIVNAAAATQ